MRLNFHQNQLINEYDKKGFSIKVASLHIMPLNYLSGHTKICGFIILAFN